MTGEVFTEKQKRFLSQLKHNELKRINILYGSVRSGKTWITLVAFAFWVAQTPLDSTFLMCAKTITSLKRNCLDLLQDLVGKDNFKYSISAKSGTLFGRRVALEGANDARAETKIRGMTLTGAYVDEITLIEKDFFAMLLSRLSKPNAKLFGSTNPDSPNHWLKKEYLDRQSELNLFVDKYEIDDNTFLDPEYVANIKSEYTGVFYQRFILGNFVKAEGLIYPMYDKIFDRPVSDQKTDVCVSIDYGTMNAFAAILWHKVGNVWYAMDEYYYSGRESGRQKTDYEYGEELDAFLANEINALIPGKKIRTIIDPSAASFIALLQKKPWCKVMKAKNAVLDGIRETATALQMGLIKISPDMKHFRDEIEGYVWQDSEGEEKPIKENDHCLTGDMLVDTEKGQIPIADLAGKSGLVWSWNGKEKVLNRFRDVRKTRSNADILKITLEDGREIKCTSDHLILTDKGWTEARRLTDCDSILEANLPI